MDMFFIPEEEKYLYKNNILEKIDITIERSTAMID